MTEPCCKSNTARKELPPPTLFGETRGGKAYIINFIADRTVPPKGSSAKGCTFQYKQ
ncbi:hypothetical protein L208DRAFT_232918 [Tricholoma matsutake]|nr:hypothetical protein L208DRAFT_232918 [Tricholoma matsutake 945]